ncbi:hypothetical protein RB195_017006 [Necator americanus]|uniref:Phospholipase A(2) n=1 Tax=Necator americanus TaxID=51031 RepID=A0ABR1C5B7_NECAM
MRFLVLLLLILPLLDAYIDMKVNYLHNDTVERCLQNFVEPMPGAELEEVYCFGFRHFYDYYIDDVGLLIDFWCFSNATIYTMYGNLTDVDDGIRCHVTEEGSSCICSLNFTECFKRVWHLFPSRVYELCKENEWNTFLQYAENTWNEKKPLPYPGSTSRTTYRVTNATTATTTTSTTKTTNFSSTDTKPLPTTTISTTSSSFTLPTPTEKFTFSGVFPQISKKEVDKQRRMALKHSTLYLLIVVFCMDQQGRPVSEGQLHGKREAREETSKKDRDVEKGAQGKHPETESKLGRDTIKSAESITDPKSGEKTNGTKSAETITGKFKTAEKTNGEFKSAEATNGKIKSAEKSGESKSAETTTGKSKSAEKINGESKSAEKSWESKSVEAFTGKSKSAEKVSGESKSAEKSNGKHSRPQLKIRDLVKKLTTRTPERGSK